ADGEVSEPFSTRFGWHIVKRTGTKGIPPKADVEASIRKSFDRDGRTKRIIKAKADKLAAEYNAKINPDGRAAVLAAASADDLAGNASVLYTVGDSVVTVAEFASVLRQWPADTDALSRMIDEGLDQTVLDYESNRLEYKYPEFRNIVGEYRDGMMLFEVSSANVWNVPASDPEGLEAFFQADKQKYATWDEPRFKGYIIYATTDSLLQEVNAFLAQEQPAAAEVGSRLKEAFPRNIKIERVVLPKGRNKVVDAVAFGGEAPDFSNEPRWKFYTSYAGRVVAQPEEAADARAAVSADYQQELEKRWVEQLRAKYPIVVNNKVLKKVKPIK
ncbi:MAG: hypothetical protein K2M97_06965, partial [Muribaculaceae bacterium]|nr:hypothetical protein [Muribaculaceae bacterium]